MSDKRLSPEARDKLAQMLREKLIRQRPRTTIWTVMGLLFLSVALVGLWYGFQPKEPLPPLMLEVFDGFDEDGTVKARLVAPGNPETNLEGLDVLWKWRGEWATTKTDRDGVARFRLADVKLAIDETPVVHVAFVDPVGAYRRDARIDLKNP